MLFSSPDYPVFLIAVFFLYALARWGGSQAAWARIAVMVLLGDVVFMLVAKDPDTLWDPIGGALLRLAAGDGRDWPGWLLGRWLVGLSLLGLALRVGRRHGAWIASDAGQRWIAIGFAGALAAIGATVAIGEARGRLDEVTAVLVGGGHLGVLAVLGIGLGAADADPRRPLGRVVVLFVASSLFYHAWASAMPGPYRYLLALLLATIVLDYYLGLWIERSERPWARRALVIVSLCSNLGVLVFFKYADFFRLDVLGLDGDRWNLILPAGISFHTFQSLSYTIDVYRRELRATRSVVEFATFVLFFPQLVAGPIVRAQDLLPQLASPPPLELHRATTGLFRIAIGLFKKIALADALALSIVERVFEAPERFSSLEVLAGVYGYALQIYLDFSAYSDIAIGSAQVLGFTLPENFRTPYRSANLQEFWRRWHISLSTWLRDYLYVTLGGSRGAAWRTYLNLILTMLLGGLWHGASWAFIVWGALHGFGLAITRYFQRVSGDGRALWWLGLGCAGLAGAGAALHATVWSDRGAWLQLAMAWLAVTPLWALLTARLGRDDPEPPGPRDPEPEGMPWRPLWTRALANEPPAAGASSWRVVEALRLVMCLAGLCTFASLQYQPSATWIPMILATWVIGHAADAIEAGALATRRWWAVIAAPLPWLVILATAPGWAWVAAAALVWIAARAARAGRGPGFGRRLGAAARRAVAVALVFHYVCLGWIFFRASSFDNALAVLRQLALLELDRANLVPLVTAALAVGFACHFYADGSFRWLRDRFVALPAWGQGGVLAGAALVLRELAHTKIVPFIYFQF